MTTPTVHYSLVTDWGTGLQAEISLKNPANAPSLTAWQLGFDYAPTITSIWNATIVSHVGGRYVIGNAAWNGAVSSGATAQFGFTAAPGGGQDLPTNVTVNGQPVGGDDGPVPTLSVADVSIQNPSSGSTGVATFAVTLSAASSADVTVAYSTADITAHAPADYVATGGSLVFAPGQTSKEVAVTVNRIDAPDPAGAKFSLTLTNPVGATIRRATGVATVSNSSAINGGVTFQVLNDWGAAFNGQVVIANRDPAQPIANWQIGFDSEATITSLWNASLVSRVAGRYTIRAANWNNVVAPGGSVSFGFTANPGAATPGAVPSNFALTQVGGGEVVLPPIANDVHAVAYNNNSIPIVIPVLRSASAPSGHPLVLTAVGAAQHGTATADTAAGTATYVPPVGYVGSDAFTYTVSDGRGSATGMVTVTVAPAPPPVARDFSVSTPQNQALEVEPLAYASDPAGYAVALVSASDPDHGTTTVRSGETDGYPQDVLYIPDPDYVGPDAFTYTVDNGHGGTATGRVAVTVLSTSGPDGWPKRVFAPYIDMADWVGPAGTFDFVGAARTQGLRFFNLAFVVAGPRDEPSWGAYEAYNVFGTEYSANMQRNIAALRALGGDVAVSFGGAINRELANVHATVESLQAAYQSVIDEYSLSRIDFDIEGADTGNTTTIELRSKAMAGLQQAAAAKGTALEITLTLPVLPTGMTHDGIGVVASAVRNGVVLDAVQVMTMWYGNAVPDPAGRMGALAIQAAESTFAQLKAIYQEQGQPKSDAELWEMVGIIPLIGINEGDTREIFSQSDSEQLVSWAAQQGVGVLSFWSLNRDRVGPNAYNASGVNRVDFEFSSIFKGFTSSS